MLDWSYDYQDSNLRQQITPKQHRLTTDLKKFKKWRKRKKKRGAYTCCSFCMLFHLSSFSPYRSDLESYTRVPPRLDREWGHQYFRNPVQRVVTILLCHGVLHSVLPWKLWVRTCLFSLCVRSLKGYLSVFSVHVKSLKEYLSVFSLSV